MRTKFFLIGVASSDLLYSPGAAKKPLAASVLTLATQAQAQDSTYTTINEEHPGT